MSLAQTIKKQRDILKLTQDELAKALGIKRATIATYERGGAKPSLEIARKMARLFAMPMEHLLQEADVVPEHEKETTHV